MENNEATCNVDECWEFSVAITDPHPSLSAKVSNMSDFSTETDQT